MNAFEVNTTGNYTNFTNYLFTTYPHVYSSYSIGKRMTNSQVKIDLVAKLVQENKIDFLQAIELLMEEVHIERQSYPVYPNYPNYPKYPWSNIIYYSSPTETMNTSQPGNWTLTTNYTKN